MIFRETHMTDRAYSFRQRSFTNGIVGTTALAMLFLVYWASLSGPFLFDDHPNFAPLYSWLRGDVSWDVVVFENGSGPLGRSISMASFAITAAMHGMSPFAFKLTNLFIHAFCAVLVFLIARFTLKEDGFEPRRDVTWLAIFVALFWAIHPIQVSTVAYAVQRMAELSALFTIVALLAFCIASMRPLRGWTRRTTLFLVIPIATLTAAFSKENGLLVPLLCLALHAGWLSRVSQIPRFERGLFFGLFLIVPAALFVVLLLWKPNYLLQGYELRDFTLLQRLLTQPRVLLDYLWGLVWPGHVTAVVHFDDVRVSTGLWTPLSTVMAIFAWLGLLVVALRVRRDHPYVLGGLLFYLGGHAMESTILPLEIAFEHRNYLPSLGIWLALGTGIQRWQANRERRGTSSPMVGAIMGIALLFTAGQTYLRTWEWRSRESLVVRAVSLRPLSARSQLDFAQVALENGNSALARQTLVRLESFESPRVRFMSQVYVSFFDCLQGAGISDQTINSYSELVPLPLTISELTVAEAVMRLVQSGMCRKVSLAQVGNFIAGMVKRSPQSGSDLAVWRMQYLAASAYELASMPDLALEQAKVSWVNSGNDVEVGMLLLRTYTILGLRADAERQHKLLKETVPEGFFSVHRRLDEWVQDHAGTEVQT